MHWKGLSDPCLLSFWPIISPCMVQLYFRGFADDFLSVWAMISPTVRVQL